MEVIKKKRILIVDDCSYALAQLEEDFSGSAEVITAKSGEEAIGILEDVKQIKDHSVSKKFDLVITDLNMPGICGFEVSSHIRTKNKLNGHRFIPVILLTSDQVSKEQARSYGCSACFSKSDKKKLVSTVKTILSI